MYKPAFLPFQSMFYEYKESDIKHNMTVLQDHDSYEIFLLTKGERYLFFNNSCHILKPGDLYILRPFDMHYTQSMSSEFYGRHVLNFSESNLEKLLTIKECKQLTDKLPSDVFHLNEKQYQRVLFFFQGISEHHSASTFLSDKLECSYLLELLSFITRLKSDDTQQPENQQTTDTKPEILEAIEYINRHYKENLNLEYVADHVHLSKYYFCRQFSKTTGATFLEYLNNIRLAKVHQLLINTNLPIAEIAEQTGFSSATQLSRTFANAYKVSPSKFRKR